MSSSLHPFVKVSLDKERHLCYGAAAYIEFKEFTGMDLLKLMKQLSEKLAAVAETEEFPIKEFRDILWAGLIHEDPDLQPREVSNMFTIATLSDLLPSVMEAFTLGLPKAESVNGNRPQMAPTRRKKSIGA